MNTFYVVLLFAVIMLAFFMVTFALSLIFKGHHMETEIGENRHMRQKGIKCAKAQILMEEKNIKNKKKESPDCQELCDDDENCGSCSL